MTMHAKKEKIAVIGAGLMGHGIAYLFAAAGHTVRIYDPSAEWRKTLPERLESSRALLGGDPALLGRISAHDQMAPAMTGTSFVFEAAPEKLPLIASFGRSSLTIALAITPATVEKRCLKPLDHAFQGIFLHRKL